MARNHQQTLYSAKNVILPSWMHRMIHRRAYQTDTSGMCRYAQSNGNDKQTITGIPEDVSLPQNEPKLQDLPIGVLEMQ